MHGLFKIDRIQYLDPVSSIYQHLPAFNDDRSFWIGDHIGHVSVICIRLGFT